MVARSAPNALTLLLSKCRLRRSWEVLLRSYELKGTSRELRGAGRHPSFRENTTLLPSCTRVNASDGADRPY
jgi:hypothetical protein